MSNRESNNQAVLSTPEKPKKGRVISVLIGVIIVVAMLASIGLWYKLTHKPFVFDAQAGQEQLSHLSKFYSEGKSCKDTVEYVDQELPSIKQSAARYNLLYQKAGCQINSDRTSAIETYQQAYKIGGVNHPAVGIILAEDYASKGDTSKAISLYKEVQKHYQESSVKDYNSQAQQEQIQSRLKELEAKK